MGAFQGVNYRNYQVPRFAKPKYAVAGFPFSHATEAGEFGLRKPSALKRKMQSVGEAAGRDVANQVQTSFEADLLQTSISDLNNLYLLIKSGPHQLLLPTAKGMNFAFTDNDTGGMYATPIGSSLVGANLEFNLTMEERVLKYMAATNMTNTEWDYMVTNSGTAATGGSSGSTAGLAAHSYSRTGYVRSGIAYVTVNGVKVGANSQPSLNIKSRAPEMDHRGRPLPTFLDINGGITMLQQTKLDLLGMSTAEQNEYTVVFGTWNDETFTFTASVSTEGEDVEISDQHMTTRLAFKGSIPFDDTNTAISLSGSAAAFSLIGY